MMHKTEYGFAGGNMGSEYGTGSSNCAHSWTPTSAYASGVPYRAVHAGHDTNGDAIYVGRAYHHGDFLPAKVIPNKRIGYVCWGGQEIPLTNYEILCGENYTWVHSSGGSVPPFAVMSGTTSNGEPLYIGRGHWQGSLTPGKIHPSHRCLYIPYGGQEIRIDSYEVLVKAPTITWVSSSGSYLPPQAVHAGHDTDGDALYVGRAYHNGDLLPAKVCINKACAYISHCGQEIVKHQFEVLCGTDFRWVGSASGHVPPNAVEAGRTSDGEGLYIGRGHHLGSLTPGKIHPSHNCLYIPYGGGEIKLSGYECLVRSGY